MCRCVLSLTTFPSFFSLFYVINISFLQFFIHILQHRGLLIRIICVVKLLFMLHRFYDLMNLGLLYFQLVENQLYFCYIYSCLLYWVFTQVFSYYLRLYNQKASSVIYIWHPRKLMKMKSFESNRFLNLLRPCVPYKDKLC